MNLETLCSKTSACKGVIGKLSTEEKNAVLITAAELLLNKEEIILNANAEDVKNARAKGMEEGMIDRLALTSARIADMADGLRQVVGLNDPVGEVISETLRPNGLNVTKRRVPLGVVGMIYESRPNVTCDAFGLCFKTGNCVILKGGSDAICSNKAIVAVLRDALKAHNLPEEACSLIEDTNRETTLAFMKMKDYVDVLIPRGGSGLIQNVVNNATIPVIETGVGNCHIYVDEKADLDMAVKVVFNAKTQRISVCNACESLLVHEAVVDTFLPMLQKALVEKNVELRADEVCLKALDTSLGKVVEATQEDWAKEYLDYILSIKSVSNVEEAIAHINKYNTSHSESIITTDASVAEQFLNEVDAACVYWNASTRFSDGNEFGFGAEIGISTQKLHARGPMGLEALTSYKYVIYGDGQVRG
ncbi:MAG: glutamate-5-semialdehyde dehydrogenase [Agathobacter sp.]|nr:glutamate-5-semialdehyde dehydrogenase [Agathobacter sp.]